MTKKFVRTIFFAIFGTILLTIFWTKEIFAGNQTLQTLPKNIKNEFSKAKINTNNVGLYIQNLNKTNKKVLLSYNANKLFAPASVMKLVTTYAGVLHLGTDFVWQTKIYSDNKPDINGNLHGNLYIFGGGDPNLTFDEINKLLTQIFQEHNIKNINGNVVFQNNFFNLSDDLKNTLSGDFDGYKFAPYNVIPKPLIFDLQTLYLMFQKDKTNNKVKVKSIRPLSQLVINSENLVLTNTASKCFRDWEDNLTYSTTTQNPNNNSNNGNNGNKNKNNNTKIVLNISGTIQKNCLKNNNTKIYIAALNNFEQNITLFNSIWQQLGGTISGSFVESNQKINLENLNHIFTYNSQTLGEIIKPINKFSNNVMARLLYLSLPLKNSNNNSNNNVNKTFSLELSNKVIKAVLRKNKINFDNATFDNGSGLSRKTKFSLYSLNALLVHAWNNHKMPEFIQSLPILGEDGTLKRRYANSSYKGKAHLKTGHINGVKNIAGYYQSKKGNRYTISFFINDNNVANMPNYNNILHQIFDYIESNDK